MAAAVLDLNINQHETWDMALSLWENEDKNIPLDLTDILFEGAFNFGDRCINMTFVVTDNNVSCSIGADYLRDLPLRGTYAIEATKLTGERSRLMQGQLIVDKGSVC